MCVCIKRKIVHKTRSSVCQQETAVSVLRRRTLRIKRCVWTTGNAVGESVFPSAKWSKSWRPAPATVTLLHGFKSNSDEEYHGFNNCSLILWRNTNLFFSKLKLSSFWTFRSNWTFWFLPRNKLVLQGLLPGDQWSLQPLRWCERRFCVFAERQTLHRGLLRRSGELNTHDPILMSFLSG